MRSPLPFPPRMTRNLWGADEMSGRMGRLDRDVHRAEARWRRDGWVYLVGFLWRADAWADCVDVAQPQGTRIYQYAIPTNIVLTRAFTQVGERRVMFIYAFLAIQYVTVIFSLTPQLLNAIPPLTRPSFTRLEVTVWVVPSLLENALAVSCIGLLLGPMYPILIKQSRDILPRWIFTGCMGWIGGIGQAGSAVLPFLTGLLASKFGIGSLQPLCVSS